MRGAAVERTVRLAGELGEQELDLLLVTNVVNARYLSGFTGSNALLLIAAEGTSRAGAMPEDVAGGKGPHRFLTDFRYATQSAEQVPEEFARQVVIGVELLDVAAEGLPAEGRLGFDDAHLSVRRHAHLRELLPEWELVPCAGMVERMRAVKDAGELERIRAASALADEALREVLAGGLVGRSEREVALELEQRMVRLGARAASFPPIVAAGAGAALPHAEAGEGTIAEDVLVIVDWGALHEQYCSDCTRTYATGEGISTRAREVYELVRDTQQRALAAVKTGPTGVELDALARELIEDAGHGEHFGHGLGHGVGLEVHEGPRLSKIAGDEPLRAGNVVTVEPGVYLPGELGVRIEDLVVVTESGCEMISGLPKELTVVG
jgi:Xaa-Pro aminopeptidase